MANIKVYPPYTLGEEIGHVIEIEAGNVGELIGKLKERFGGRFIEATAGCAVLVNGIDHYRLKGMNTKLEEGDFVAFINPASPK